MMTMPKLPCFPHSSLAAARHLLLVGAGLWLSACGGGGGGGAPAATAPATTLSISASSASVVLGQAVTLSWRAANPGDSNCTASGAWSGSVATSGSLAVTPPSAGTSTYTLTCSGVANSASVTATVGPVANIAALVVDNGPAAASGVLNVPYVSVTLCRPGTTICQTIDHVMVDTGSYGLRVLTAIDPALNLAAVNTPSGLPAAECAQFVSGYAWGALRLADVRIGGELAAGIPVHLMNDANFTTQAPADCRSSGGNLGTVAALGANGILGVGVLRQDCGDTCANGAQGAAYYACNGAVCSPSRMPLAQQVSNPVAAFAVNNNGVILLLPSVPAGGLTSANGSLIFGIGTQANNRIGTETVYAANAAGNFSTTYKGRVLSASFLDSGSNGIYFGDASLRACSTSVEFYCPLVPLTVSAVTGAYDGSASGAVNVTIENVDLLGASIKAASVGGNNSSGSSVIDSNAFDWGLPFFFGRRVFIGLEGTISPSGVGPYWAY
ncbi:hypothetical protein AAKU55_002918 [Oxalobacteraceae bacterium GrIS 1.11]